MTTATRSCSIDGCEAPVKARGWCGRHYARWWKTGDPGPAEYLNVHVTEHGTMNEYQNYGCRCDLCKAAMSDYQRALLEAPCGDCGKPIYGRYRSGALCRDCRAKRRTIPIEQRHGTETGYSKGCRCSECRAAVAAARRNRRAANREHEREVVRLRRLRKRTLMQKAVSHLNDDGSRKVAA